MDNKPLDRGRAWIEVDLSALCHNLDNIKSVTPDNCEIMAVVKANAYGHGVKEVAKKLAEKGVKTFAVATISEAVQLNETVPGLDIMVLGCTHPKDAKFLSENNFLQLVADGSYAKALNDTGYKLRIHIAIDTGMHRLGIEPENYDEITAIYKYENLKIEGIATHLASPDSLGKSDISFTNEQHDKFHNLLEKLKNDGYNTGKIHTQSSYGIYNYPELKCDYIRPGIMLYGVHSQNDETKINTDLRPVLSLKAIIAQVRWIKAGEGVSYGRSFVTEKPTKIATVCIGYADGVPRHASGKNAKVIVNGVKVPIIGKICMDMLVLDITDAENTQAGDIATLIGKDGNEEIRCEDLAEAAGTITNDILSGLSERLPKVYING